jgi:hypothetical protein
MDAAKQAMKKIGMPESPSPFWQILMPVIFIILAVMYFSMSAWYTNQYGQFRSEANSVNNCLAVRRQTLGEAIDPLTPITRSVCGSLLSKSGVYGQIDQSKTAIVNWRPLTVRMAGYLGGVNTVLDGAFDMVKGIQLALALGARCFIFDIDYLDNKPCEPRLIHRDDNGVMRSLHTGSVGQGMDTLNKMAFNNNYDPVIVVLYLRRIPPGRTQRHVFLKALATEMDPLSTYHLGSTEQGNFHNCRSESRLFSSEITNFQKKFIVLCNYNTAILPSTSNPKDNLDFWVNARLYVDESGKSAMLGEVTSSVPNGQIAYAQVGSTSQYLMIPDGDKANFVEKASNTFKIAMGSMSDIFTPTQLSTMLNTLGIQAVALDVIRLGASSDHLITLRTMSDPPNLASLSNATNSVDPLSFWAYAGWSKKNIIEGFESPPPVPRSAPINGFIIPKPVVPKKPPPSTNSNGGLVSIL